MTTRIEPTNVRHLPMSEHHALPLDVTAVDAARQCLNQRAVAHAARDATARLCEWLAD